MLRSSDLFELKLKHAQQNRNLNYVKYYKLGISMYVIIIWMWFNYD